MTMSAASDTKYSCERPNTTVATPKTATPREHLRADVARDRPPGERHRDDGGADAGRGAQPAEAVRPDVQDVARVRRQQRDRAAEQHGKEVERDGAEDHLLAPDEAQALEKRVPGVGRRRARGLVGLHADDEQEGGGEQCRDRGVDDVGPGEVDEAADRGTGDRRDLPGARVHRDRAREQRGRHEVRHDRLPRRHRERARDAEHDHHGEHRPGDGRGPSA